MPSMKAVRIHAYGGVDRLMLEEASRPTPGPDEVLIRVHATSVNPFDCAVRAGYMAGYFNYTLPYIPGTDVSGVVEEVGDLVTNVAPGMPVYTRAGVTRDGAYAEYAVVPAGDVAPKPASLDHITAAAIPHAVLTAWQGLYELAQLQAGQTVLIHGAAGGVGHIAVQLAKLRGATVIGTASLNAPFLAGLGVDQVINYATTPFESAVRDVDVVLDLMGGETQRRSYAVLKPGGVLISAVQMPDADAGAMYGVRQHLIMTNPPIGPALTDVAHLVDAGRLKPYVSQVFALEDIQQAHALIEQRHACGKIAIQISA